jgi:hypothetical protein
MIPHDDILPEEKPRYLLPDGCKDLIDALRLERGSELSADSIAASPAAEPMPASISIPDPVLVRDLAAALHLKPHEVIRMLMQHNIFANQHSEIEFSKVLSICAKLGVVAHQII